MCSICAVNKTPWLTYARNALDRDLANTLLKTGETWIYLTYLYLLFLYQLFNDLRTKQISFNTTYRIQNIIILVKNIVSCTLMYTDLFLFLNDDGEFSVRYAGIKFTAHECGSFIIFYITQIFGFGYLYVFRESL